MPDMPELGANVVPHLCTVLQVMHRICNDILTSVKGCVCAGTLVLNEHTSSTSRACYACGNALHPFFLHVLLL